MKKPLTRALNTKRGTNVLKSNHAKGIKAPASVGVKSSLAKNSTKIRKP